MKEISDKIDALCYSYIEKLNPYPALCLHTFVKPLKSFWLSRLVQSLSHVWLFVIPCTAARQAPLSITNSRSLPKLMSIGGAIQPSHPLSSPSPPAFNFSQNQVFSNESVLCIRWPKYCSFSISPSSQYSEYSVFISFRIGRVVLMVRGILKGHLSSTTIRKHHSAFLMIQLTHLYTTTGKTIVLTLQTFVSKVMSQLFNMLSRFVMGFPGAQG